MSTPEPASPPSPRALRTMSIVRWVLLALVSLVAVVTVWRHWIEGDATAQQREERYYCPMHPQIRSPDPGECPICHMDLEPIPEERLGRDPGEPEADVAATEGPPVVGLALTLERQQLIGLTTAPAVRERLARQLRLPAEVVLPDDAVSQVHARVSGFLEKVDVRRRGTEVEAGQTLAWIYSPQILQAAEELLTAIRWSGGSGGDAGGELGQAARRSLLVLGASVGDVDALVRSRKVPRLWPLRAPADGVVTGVGAVLGAYVTPETPLFTLVDRSRVWVVARVPQRDMPHVHAGLDADFSLLNATPTRAAVHARVELVEPAVDRETRTAGARLVLSNPALDLMPGQLGEVLVTLPAEERIAVPRDAMIDTGRWQYVFVALGDGRFEPRVVRPGQLFDERREILEGLVPGERVVVRGGFMLDAESRLQAALGKAPAGAPHEHEEAP